MAAFRLSWLLLTLFWGWSPSVPAWRASSSQLLEKIESLRTMLKKEPAHAINNWLLADALKTLLMGERGTGIDYGETEEYKEAIKAFEIADQLIPDTFPQKVDLKMGFGTLLQRGGEIQKSLQVLQRATTIMPSDSRPYTWMGFTYEGMGDYTKALAAYQKSVQLEPFAVESLSRLPKLKKFVNSLDAAGFKACVDQVERAVVKGEHHVRNPAKGCDGDFQSLFLAFRTLQNKANPKVEVLHFALAKALEDMRQYDWAFRHLRKGNIMARAANPDFNIQKIHRHAASVVAMYRPEVWGDTWALNLGFQGVGTADDPERGNPIFIVGMPRSGSTLVEQILASHPQVYAGGEDTPWNPLMSKLIPEISAHPGEPAGPVFKKYGRQYVQRMLRRAAKLGATRPTDKHLLNFWHIGLIHLVLPHARIIHTLRNGMDCCLSNFKHRFDDGSIDFSYSLTDLGQFYSLYRQVMDHWDLVLPEGKILHVNYEDIVSDLEGQSRRMLEHARLPWNPAVLSFWKSKRASVETHSAAQVRRPIYNTSVAKWRRFEKFLDPLKRALGEYYVPLEGMADTKSSPARGKDEL